MNKRRHRLQMVTLCISATMVLVLLGLVVLSVLTANNLQKSLRENIEISVILGDTVSVMEPYWGRISRQNPMPAKWFTSAAKKH